jgi:hypothetical protein
VNALTKGGIDPFNKGRVDSTLTMLGGMDEIRHYRFGTLNDLSIAIQHAFEALLHHLHDCNVRPLDHLAASHFAPLPRKLAAKRIPKRTHVTGQAIHCQQ